jgi:hypothetical protein
VDPSIQNCCSKFKEEFKLLLHRAKPNLLSAMANWIDA